MRDDDAVPRFGQVEKLVDSYHLVMGGSCCIFASQAAKLGLKVLMLGRVGDDAFGRLLLDTLNNAGVDTRHMVVDSSLKTGLTVHLTQADDRAMLTHLGSLNSLQPDDIKDDYLKSARHLHYGSLYLHTGLLPAWTDILKRSKSYAYRCRSIPIGTLTKTGMLDYPMLTPRSIYFYQMNKKHNTSLAKLPTHTGDH